MKQSIEGDRTNAHGGRQIWKSIARSTAMSNHYLGCIEEASGDPKVILKSILRRDEVTKLPLYSSQDILANQFEDFFEDKIHKNRDGLTELEAPVVSLPPCYSELCVFSPPPRHVP